MIFDLFGFRLFASIRSGLEFADSFDSTDPVDVTDPRSDLLLVSLVRSLVMRSLFPHTLRAPCGRDITSEYGQAALFMKYRIGSEYKSTKYLIVAS